MFTERDLPFPLGKAKWKLNFFTPVTNFIPTAVSNTENISKIKQNNKTVNCLYSVACIIYTLWVRVTYISAPDVLIVFSTHACKLHVYSSKCVFSGFIFSQLLMFILSCVLEYGVDLEGSAGLWSLVHKWHGAKVMLISYHWSLQPFEEDGFVSLM